MGESEILFEVDDIEDPPDEWADAREEDAREQEWRENNEILEVMGDELSE